MVNIKNCWIIRSWGHHLSFFTLTTQAPWLTSDPRSCFRTWRLPGGWRWQMFVAPLWRNPRAGPALATFLTCGGDGGPRLMCLRQTQEAERRAVCFWSARLRLPLAAAERDAWLNSAHSGVTRGWEYKWQRVTDILTCAVQHCNTLLHSS